MLDDKERVAAGFQPLQGGEQRFAVGGMKTCRRFVEHVHDAEQLRRKLRREAQALQLAGRQRRRAAVECEIAEAEIDQRRQTLEQFFGDALRGDAFLFGQIRRATHIRRGLVRGAAGGDAPFGGRAHRLFAEDRVVRCRVGVGPRALCDRTQQRGEPVERQP